MGPRLCFLVNIAKRRATANPEARITRVVQLHVVEEVRQTTLQTEYGGRTRQTTRRYIETKSKVVASSVHHFELAVSATTGLPETAEAAIVTTRSSEVRVGTALYLLLLLGRIHMTVWASTEPNDLARERGKERMNSAIIAVPLESHRPRRRLSPTPAARSFRRSIQFTREESGTSTKRYFFPLG